MYKLLPFEGYEITFKLTESFHRVNLFIKENASYFAENCTLRKISQAIPLFSRFLRIF